MAGRRDFVIVWTRAVTDSRVLCAADLYVDRGLAKRTTAVATVLGHLALISIWTSRETDDGRIPGDGVGMVHVATATAPAIAKAIVEVLSNPDVDLITRDEQGLRQRGFEEAYQPIIAKRERDTVRKRDWRAKKSGEDVVSRVTSRVTSPVTSHGMSRRTGPDRTEIPPQPPVTGGCDDGGSALPLEAPGKPPSGPRPEPDEPRTAGPSPTNPEARAEPAPVTPTDAAVFDEIARRCGVGTLGTTEQRARAKRVFDLRRTAGDVARDELRSIVNELENRTPEMRESTRKIRMNGRMRDKDRGIG